MFGVPTSMPLPPLRGLNFSFATYPPLKRRAIFIRPVGLLRANGGHVLPLQWAWSTLRILDCGGKRSATPLSFTGARLYEPQQYPQPKSL
jgi:hypothetical protein